MNHNSVVSLIMWLGYLEVAGCAFALILMYSRGLLRDYKALSLFLLTRILAFAVCMPIQHITGHQISVKTGYHIYFYVYWVSYAIEAILGYFIIFGVYRLAMAPLPGLQRLGTLMFRWAGGIALAVSLTMAVGPHFSSSTFIQQTTARLQETQSVLTLCMLLFVCLAIRPMGLSYRSKIFGVCLGLGVMATSDLVSVAWLLQKPKMFSVLSIISGVAICLTLAIWSAYIAIPEPKRRMIILPTTSPFLRWNQISLALGDEPGFVAIGDVSPDVFAPAEVEVMRRASVKMRRTGTI